MSVSNDEILYKNEKLTFRLFQLKKEKYGLTFVDRMKFSLLSKFVIPMRESEIIDKCLIKEDQLRHENIRDWVDFNGQHHPIFEGPYITEIGLQALKKNYYQICYFLERLKTPHFILTLILTVLSIGAILFNITKDQKIEKLNKQLEIKSIVIDSLKIELSDMKKIIKEGIK